MLKKITLAVLASTMALSAEGNFSGFRVVGSVGATRTSFKVGSLINEGATGANAVLNGELTLFSKPKTSKYSPTLALSAVYGEQFDCMYVGGMIEISKSLNSFKLKYEDGEGFAKVSTSGFQIAISPVIGYVVTPKTMIYVGVGARRESMSAKLLATDTHTEISTKKKFVISPEIRIGLDSYVSDSVFLRAEISKTFAVKRTLQVNEIAAPGMISKGKIRTSSTRFMIGAGYKF